MGLKIFLLEICIYFEILVLITAYSNYLITMMHSVQFHRIAEKLTANVFKLSSARYLSQYPIRFHETQDMWRRKDGLSQRWQLIYKAPMERPLKFATTYLTLTTGIISAAGIYYGAFVYDAAEINKPVIIGDGVIIANSATECLIYLGAFIALHLAIKIVLAKYVVRLYKSDDEYMAVFRGHLFNSISKHKFHLNDFHKINTMAILPWNESRYSLGSRKGIIMDNYFKTPEYLNYLLNKKKLSEEEQE